MVPAMTRTEREAPHSRPPLYRYFCDFYALLVDVKRGLAAVPPGLGESLRAPQLSPAAVHERLRDRLRAQDGTVRQSCTPEQRDLYREAQYAMAALADEQLLLEVDWPGRVAWLELTLESALFDTRMAGVRFYRVIDRLLAVPTPTAAHAELAIVLLATLQAGFRGELRGAHEMQTLARRRRELVEFVHAVRGDVPVHYAFGQAYEHTVGPTVPEPADRRLAPLSPWLNAAKLGGMAYIVLAAAIWFITLYPFEQLVAADPGAQKVASDRPARVGEGRIASPAVLALGAGQSSASIDVGASSAALPSSTPDAEQAGHAKVNARSGQGGTP